jgi:dTDP-glucose 4,6-dehydratase
MIAKALNNEKLPLYGKGENVRDWLYVEDHCKALDLILHKGKPGEVYNIGGGNEKRNIEVVKLILRELNKPESLITFVEDRPGHDLRYAVDYSKISKELDWQPTVNFKAGIKTVVKWYLDNRDWWQDILNKS